MSIHSQVDSTRELTIYTVNGEVSFNEIISSLEKYYSKNPTLNVLWDFSKSVGTGVSIEQIEKIAIFVSKMMPKTRIGGKSAAITPGDLEYGLGRMASAFLEIHKYKFGYRNFRRFEDAIAWIEEENGDTQ